MIERHLPYFAVVAEEEHFQRAADRLCVTQSALSRRIQVMEHELGFQLFVRSARGAKLTPAGESLYADVRKIRNDLARATDRARSVMRGELGSLNIAINPSASSSPLAVRTLQIFRDRNPTIDLNLEMMYSEDQGIALQAGTIDIGLLYKFRVSNQLTYTDVSSDQLQLILPRAHPLAQKDRLTIADLDTIEFIWPRRSHSPRLSDWMISTCHRSGFSPRICMEVQSVESIINIVAIGTGAGFAMNFQASQLPQSVVSREVDGLTLAVPLCLAWRSGYGSPILPHLLAALESARTEAGMRGA